MPPNFTLNISIRPGAYVAEFDLRDAHGAQVGFREVDFTRLPASRVHGLFNLRDFVRHYGTKVEDIGMFLGREILGDLLAPLARDRIERTLTICLPDPSAELAAALARVPWEIAQAAPGQPTLAEANLRVRVVTGAEPDNARALPLEPGQPVRMLLVFAETPDSQPLAMRQERHELLDMFNREVFPKRRVELDVLAHGVTRDRLRAYIRERGGYHAVHWSGHGRVNRLELYGAGGGSDEVSGGGLVDLFVEAGGWIPRLFFLSACHSGDVGAVLADWEVFRARVADGEAATREGGAVERPLPEQLAEQPGYTGTAHQLLASGVPAVVAMRYAVGDDYARDLAREFYRRLLADTQLKPVDAALNLARNDLRRAGQRDASRGYDPCDHATPVPHGRSEVLDAPKGRSASLDRREPRPPLRIAELSIKSHPHFVGRSRELAELGTRWIGEEGVADCPAALIQAMGGMGKTALAAEVVDLWQREFEWVLVFQAKPQPLPLEEFLRGLHERLLDQQGVYARRITEFPAEAIYRVADTAEFRGEKRYAVLRENLLLALRDEKILLVLDNFETNLKASPVGVGFSPQPDDPPSWTEADSHYECRDAEWDKTLTALVAELADSRSRVLMTSRHRPAAWAGEGVHVVALGSLPPGEAALFVRRMPALRTLVFGDARQQALARRILNAGRGHPLLLDRLARLAAAGEAQRATLLEALDHLEGRADFSKLPDLFTRGAKAAVQAEERAYLQDALETSLDWLIERAGAEARHLLWVLSLADEPVMFFILARVWFGEKSLEQEEIDADPMPWLNQLVAAGLVTEERWNDADKNPEFTCHELVRERIARWMVGHSEERHGRDETSVWVLYGEWLTAVFNYLLHKDQGAAQEVGRRAMGYFVRAGAYENLSLLTSWIVTSNNNPKLLKQILPLLITATDQALPGRPRWSSRCYLADALTGIGQLETGLHLYRQAELEAREAKHWSDAAWIVGNCAGALLSEGYLEEARQKYIQLAEIITKHKHDEISLVGAEIEVLRISILQSKAKQVLPNIEDKLGKIEAWYKRSLSGEILPETQDQENLLRVLISCLDTAKEAYSALSQWLKALACVERIIQIEKDANRSETEIGLDRLNRAVILNNLDRRDEALKELETLINIFEATEDDLARGKALSSIASIYMALGDFRHAVNLECRALNLLNKFPDPKARAVSHGNLAISLNHLNDQIHTEKSRYHQLAAATYQLCSGLEIDFQTSLGNYATSFHRARTAHQTPFVPTFAELLARPDFTALRDWLDQRGVDRDAMQAQIDQFLQIARKSAEQEGAGESPVDA